MAQRRRSFVDRRSGEDRRKVHNLDYFSDGGAERRVEYGHILKGCCPNPFLVLLFRINGMIAFLTH
jgi:hypothetical protein